MQLVTLPYIVTRNWSCKSQMNIFINDQVTELKLTTLTKISKVTKRHNCENTVDRVMPLVVLQCTVTRHKCSKFERIFPVNFVDK